MKPNPPTDSTDAAPGTDASGGRTELGRRLRKLRRRIVESGARLLGWRELDDEVAERRGQTRTGAGDSVGESVSRVREPLSPQELHDPGAHYYLLTALVACSMGAWD